MRLLPAAPHKTPKHKSPPALCAACTHGSRPRTFLQQPVSQPRLRQNARAAGVSSSARRPPSHMLGVLSASGDSPSALGSSGTTPRLQAGSLSRAMSGSGSALPPPPGSAPLSHQGSLRRRSKAEIADLFLANLRARGSLDVDAPGFAEDIRQHFDGLPSR